MVHENSIECFYNLDTTSRRRIVLDVYKSNTRPLTDREVVHALGFKDMNSARPRITELIEDGLLVEVGKTKDALTGKTVRLVKVFEKEQQLSFV